MPKSRKFHEFLTFVGVGTTLRTLNPLVMERPLQSLLRTLTGPLEALATMMLSAGFLGAKDASLVSLSRDVCFFSRKLGLWYV